MIFELLRRTQRTRDYGFWILFILGFVLRSTSHGTASTLVLGVAIAIAIPDGFRFGKRVE